MAAVLVHALLPETGERGPEHQQRHADAGRRIQPERHRGDVVAPALRRRRRAIHVYARLPSSTPNAVPGNIFPNTTSAGNPNAPTSTAAMKPRIDRLSTIRPKKPLRSAATNQRGRRMFIPATPASPCARCARFHRTCCGDASRSGPDRRSCTGRRRARRSRRRRRGAVSPARRDRRSSGPTRRGECGLRAHRARRRRRTPPRRFHTPAVPPPGRARRGSLRRRAHGRDRGFQHARGEPAPARVRGRDFASVARGEHHRQAIRAEDGEDGARRRSHCGVGFGFATVSSLSRSEGEAGRG